MEDSIINIVSINFENVFSWINLKFISHLFILYFRNVIITWDIFKCSELLKSISKAFCSQSKLYLNFFVCIDNHFICCRKACDWFLVFCICCVLGSFVFGSRYVTTSVRKSSIFSGLVAIEKGAFWSASTTVANFTFFTYFISVAVAYIISLKNVRFGFKSYERSMAKFAYFIYNRLYFSFKIFF